MVTTKENSMREIMIDSVVLHGSSADTQKLERIRKLLKLVSKQEPTQTLAKKRIPAFKLRPKLPIGYKVTLRKEDAAKILQIALSGITELKESCFTLHNSRSAKVRKVYEITQIHFW